MVETLLLNASYEPIKIISWQRAVCLSFLGKVEVIEEYDHEVHSVSIAIRMPAVVRLLRYVHLGTRRPPLTKLNMLARDSFNCQYCARSLNYQDATMDHILPRSRGGLTLWTNVVASCHSCNRKKGGRTPQEASMPLLSTPHQPEWLPVLSVRLNSHLPKSWRSFLARQWS